MLVLFVEGLTDHVNNRNSNLHDRFVETPALSSTALGTNLIPNTEVLMNKNLVTQNSKFKNN